MIKQLRQQSLACLHEFTVHACNIELAQVEPGSRMRFEPGEHGQDTLPRIGILDDQKRLAEDQLAKCWKHRQRLRRQGIEGLGLRHLADQGEAVALGRHHDRGRHQVAPELAMFDLVPNDVVANPPPRSGLLVQTANPRANLVEAGGHRLRRRASQA